MTRKPSSPNRQDLLWLFERMLKVGPCRIETIDGDQGETFVIENGEDYAVIPIHIARYVLELAKQASWPRGPHTKPTYNWHKEYWVIRRARRRRRELQAADKTKKAIDALWDAAEEVAETEDAKRLGLSAANIYDKMQRKRSRR
jgi:hypothetical protein